MRKFILPIVILLAVITVSTSCKKALETAKNIFPEQTTDLPEVTDTLPPLDSVRISGFPVTEIPLNSVFPLPTVVQPFNLDSIVRSNTGNVFGAGDITSVKVKQFVLKIKAWGDSANNIANFSTASFTFSSNTKTDQLPVASVTFDDSFSLEKIISGNGTPELRPYLGGNELYYNISASLRRHTTKNLKISIIATVTMK